ncbi:hypothetical protein BOX15_Mlig001502g1, partial [Macrostomum lignano]
PYWDARRELVDTAYKTLPMFNENKCIRLTEEMPLETTLSQFVSYLKSHSAYQTYLERVQPASPDVNVLNVFVNKLTPLLQSSMTNSPETSEHASSTKPEPSLTLLFPLTIIVCVP